MSTVHLTWNFWHWSVSDIDHRQIGACCAGSKCGTFLFVPFISHCSLPAISGKDSPTHAASNSRSPFPWGWSGGAMVLGKLPVPGRPTIWIIVGQGPTALHLQ